MCKTNTGNDYTFDNNPVYWADPSGADATSLIQELWNNTPKGTNSFWVNTEKKKDSSTEECCGTFKKLLEWFDGKDYEGSGWGNGLRTLVKDAFGMDNNSSNIITTGILSMLQAGEVNLEGNALRKISNDQAIIKYEVSLILQAMADAKFGKQAFAFKSKKSVQFGGERAAGEMWDQFKNPLNPAYADTWKVAMNELTWLVRSTTVSTTIGVDSSGKITMWHSFSDVFDLRPSPGRSDAYNKSTMILGTLYHDLLGGNDKMRVNAAEIETLIQQGTNAPMTKQPNGNFQRIIDAGRDIGTDRATGQQTSIYTIITNQNGELVTSFPGRP